MSAAVAGFLEASGLAMRVQQAAAIDAWKTIVGRQIAAVTEAQVVAADGTLFVAVRTNAWMTELTMLERDLLRTLHEHGYTGVKRIRWQLMR